MILGIDHIGLATDDPGGTAPFLKALGMTVSDAGAADDYGVVCEFWSLPGDGVPAVELVSPSRADSSIGGRLDKHGPGLYHVAFRVDALETEMERLRGHGFITVDRRPCAGARPGMRVAFLYARRPAGLLVELVQYREVGAGGHA